MKANLLKAEIVANNLTAADLAERLDISPKSMYNKINGDTQFTIDEAVKICTALKITDAEKKVNIFLT